MKKIICISVLVVVVAVVIALGVLLVMEDCGTGVVSSDIDSSDTVVKEEKMKIDKDVEFVIVEKELTDSKYGKSYFLILENDELIFMGDFDTKTYARYRVGDTISGHLKLKGHPSDLNGNFVLDGDSYIAWHCEFK